MSATLEMVEVRTRKLLEQYPNDIEIAYMLSDIALVRSQLEQLLDRAGAGTIRLNLSCGSKCGNCGRHGSEKVIGQSCLACGCCKGVFKPN